MRIDGNDGEDGERERATQRGYSIGEVATRTGVSLRTLRHYDQIGLLRPAREVENAYRVYREADLLRLQQILTLRYLGFSLRAIRSLLDQPDLSQLAAIRAQRQEMRARIAGLERVERAIGRVLERHAASGRWDWELMIEATDAAQRGLERGEQHMTPEEMRRQFAELAQEVPDAERVAVEQGWTALLRDLRAARDLDPASPEAQSLGARWDTLMEATLAGFRGRDDLAQAVGEGYADNAYAQIEGAPTPDDFAQIAAIHAAREGSK